MSKGPVVKKLGIGCGGLILILIVIGIVNAPETPTSVTTVGDAPATGAVGSNAPQAKIGDKVRSGNWEYTVTKVETAKTITWSNFNNTTTAVGTFLIVSMTLRNVGDRNFPINTFDFQATDHSGAKYDAASALGAQNGFLTHNNLTPLGSQFPPGLDVKTAVLFDVNPSGTSHKLILKQANGTLVALD